jgi:hypothetical protein
VSHTPLSASHLALLKVMIAVANACDQGSDHSGQGRLPKTVAQGLAGYFFPGHRGQQLRHLRLQGFLEEPDIHTIAITDKPLPSTVYGQSARPLNQDIIMGIVETSLADSSWTFHRDRLWSSVVTSPVKRIEPNSQRQNSERRLVTTTSTPVLPTETSGAIEPPRLIWTDIVRALSVLLLLEKDFGEVPQWCASIAVNKIWDQRGPRMLSQLRKYGFVSISRPGGHPLLHCKVTDKGKVWMNVPVPISDSVLQDIKIAIRKRQGRRV